MKQLPESHTASLKLTLKGKGSAHRLHLPLHSCESLTLYPHLQQGPRQASFLNEKGSSRTNTKPVLDLNLGKQPSLNG